MKKYLLFTLIILVQFSSCFTYQSLRIQNGVCSYLKHGLVVSIPNGWEVVEKIPYWVRYKEWLLNRDKIMFSKEDFKGFIIIFCKELNFNLSSLIVNKDNFHSQLAFAFEWRKKNLDKDFRASNYTYKIYPLINCIPICPISCEIWDSKDIKLVEKQFFNIHSDNETCSVIITLASQTEKFNQNYKDYEYLVNSLTVTSSNGSSYKRIVDSPKNRNAYEVRGVPPKGMTIIWTDAEGKVIERQEGEK